jgi:phospholipase/carboxylesterase
MALQEIQIGQVTCLVDQPRGPPAMAMVLAHGYAMDAGQLAPLASAMGLPATLYFPHAPLQLPTGGRSWWPLDEHERSASLAQGPRDLCDAHPVGREQARQALLSVLRHAAASHPGLPLVLAGFSQGGMLACDTLLLEGAQVQGLILLSASRIAIDEWHPRLQRFRDLPVLVAHGTRDQDLALSAGEALRDALQAAGAEVTWVCFEGGHETPITVWRSAKCLMLQIAQRASEA